MKISDLKALIPSLKVNDIEVDPMHVVERHFFEKSYSRSDYREQVIDLFIKNKKSFCTTCNSVHMFAKNYVQVICPKCGKHLTGSSGCGSLNNHTITYECKKCDVTIGITTPDNGYSVRFSE
jgi:predicted RNA-binding Zn-ribbon protein involved in translation (DUF1610 family)